MPITSCWATCCLWSFQSVSNRVISSSLWQQQPGAFRRYSMSLLMCCSHCQLLNDYADPAGSDNVAIAAGTAKTDMFSRQSPAITSSVSHYRARFIPTFACHGITITYFAGRSHAYRCAGSDLTDGDVDPAEVIKACFSVVLSPHQVVVDLPRLPITALLSCSPSLPPLAQRST